MSKITASADFDKVKDDEQARILALFGEQVLSVVNGNLDFATNINCKLMSISFATANANVSTAHSLGRQPTGYIVYQKSANLNVYDGTSANTSSVINLRSSAAGTASMIVF